MVLAAIGVALTTPLCAQVELGPRLGIYLPVGSVVKEGAALPGGPVEKQQVGAPLIGAQALFWVKPWIALETSAVLTPSMVAVTDSTGTTDHSSTIIIASARAIVPLTSRKGMWSFYVGAGVGLVNRSGTVWQYQSGTTARTWVASFGGQTPISQNMHMRFEFEDNYSTAEFDRGLATATQGRPHHDLILAITLEFPIGHH